MTLTELARQAGVWQETIQLFAQRGLLEEPSEPDAYDEGHLRRVRFVARMQAEHQLRLNEIREVLDANGGDIEAAEAALCGQAEPDPGRAGPGPSSRAALTKRTGVPTVLLAELTCADLLPEEGPYGGHHVWLVEAAMELLDSGLELETVVEVGKLGLSVAEAEVDAIFGEVGRGKPPGEALSGTEDRRAAIGRLLSVSRHGATAALMASLAKANDESKQLAMESIHVPSRLFLARFGLDLLAEERRAGVSAAIDAVQQDPGSASDIDAEPLREQGRLLLALGRFAEAANLLESAMAHPAMAADGAAWCYLALAHAVEGATERSLNAAARAVERSPDSPRVHAFRAAVLALAATRAGDVFLATARVHDCLAAVEASRNGQSNDPLEELEALLTRGRLCTVMPEGFGVREAGLADLNAVLRGTTPDAAATLGLPVPGALELMRINALYYAGMAFVAAGRHEEASPLLREVVSLDPISPFGTRAFQAVSG